MERNKADLLQLEFEVVLLDAWFDLLEAYSQCVIHQKKSNAAEEGPIRSRLEEMVKDAGVRVVRSAYTLWALHASEFRGMRESSSWSDENMYREFSKQEILTTEWSADELDTMFEYCNDLEDYPVTISSRTDFMAEVGRFLRAIGAEGLAIDGLFRKIRARLGSGEVGGRAAELRTEILSNALAVLELEQWPGKVATNSESMGLAHVRAWLDKQLAERRHEGRVVSGRFSEPICRWLEGSPAPVLEAGLVAVDSSRGMLELERAAKVVGSDEATARRFDPRAAGASPFELPEEWVVMVEEARERSRDTRETPDPSQDENYERDKWLYEQYMTPKNRPLILAELNEQIERHGKNWDPIDYRSGCRSAALRHLERYNLPELPKRRTGKRMSAVRRKTRLY